MILYQAPESEKGAGNHTRIGALTEGLGYHPALSWSGNPVNRPTASHSVLALLLPIPAGTWMGSAAQDATGGKLT